MQKSKLSNCFPLTHFIFLRCYVGFAHLPVNDQIMCLWCANEPAFYLYIKCKRIPIYYAHTETETHTAHVRQVQGAPRTHMLAYGCFAWHHRLLKQAYNCESKKVLEGLIFIATLVVALVFVCVCAILICCMH